jgi:hypothetical protein
LVTYNASQAPTGNTSSDSPYCSQFKTYYQLSVDTVTATNRTDLPTLSYTSYVRPVAVNNSLLVQQCNFSTAFLTMTVDIANDSSVALSSQYGLPQDRVVEPIGSPTIRTAYGVLAGFLQAIRDLYEGYVLWDINEESTVLLGNGPRLYGNTTNLNQTTVTQPGTHTSLLAVPFRSPLEDFTNTLNELALRYALTAMPNNDAARVSANEHYFGPDSSGNYYPWDRRNESIPKTRLSSTQSVVQGQLPRCAPIQSLIRCRSSSSSPSNIPRNSSRRDSTSGVQRHLCRWAPISLLPNRQPGQNSSKSRI